MRGDFREFRQDFKEAHEKIDLELDDLKQRTTTLETYLDVNGHIAKVLDLRRRRTEA